MWLIWRERGSLSIAKKISIIQHKIPQGRTRRRPADTPATVVLPARAFLDKKPVCGHLFGSGSSSDSAIRAAELLKENLSIFCSIQRDNL